MPNLDRTGDIEDLERIWSKIHKNVGDLGKVDLLLFMCQLPRNPRVPRATVGEDTKMSHCGACTQGTHHLGREMGSIKYYLN